MPVRGLAWGCAILELVDRFRCASQGTNPFNSGQRWLTRSFPQPVDLVLRRDDRGPAMSSTTTAHAPLALRVVRRGVPSTRAPPRNTTEVTSRARSGSRGVGLESGRRCSNQMSSSSGTSPIVSSVCSIFMPFGERQPSRVDEGAVARGGGSGYPGSRHHRSQRDPRALRSTLGR
jgi:hypothetical protein